MGTSNKQGNSVGWIGGGQNPNTPSYSRPFISSEPYMPKLRNTHNQQQEGLAYQNFLRQQQYPMQHLQQYASLLGLGGQFRQQPSQAPYVLGNGKGIINQSVGYGGGPALQPAQPAQPPMSFGSLAQAPANAFRGVPQQSSQGIFNSQSPLETRGLGALPISSFTKAPQ